MDKINIVYRIKSINLKNAKDFENQTNEYLSEEDLTEYDLLFSDIKINGKPFIKRTVDFLALHKTLLNEKTSFYIFTCSCGIPGCAGVWDSIKVSNQEDRVIWRFDKVKYDLLIKEEISKELVVDGKDYVLMFDKEQYKNEIEGFVKKMEEARASQSKAIVLEADGDMPTIHNDIKDYPKWLNDDSYRYQEIEDDEDDE